ncbi:MAG: hypothetical protein Q7T11_06775, partial [Deltaproteobacteria bacterium]|nr:hypothetical protein [Deltaproteobacteria bacterium]
MKNKLSFLIGMVLLNLLVFCITPLPAFATPNRVTGTPPALTPLWMALLNNELDKISGKNSVKPLERLANHPACLANPFQEQFVQKYGGRFLNHKTSEAGVYGAQFAGYLSCISLEGMREWDNALTKYFKALFKIKNNQIQKQGIQATINMALMVFDHLNYTGWSESQMLIAAELPKFEAALGPGTEDSLICADYQGGNVYEFASASKIKGSILKSAVRTIANKNGELGLGMCPLCEMAGANFEGVCNRGMQQLMECLTGGGKEPMPVGKKGKTGKETAASKAVSKGTGEGSGNNWPGDPMHGMTETELKLMSCGLGANSGREMLSRLGMNLPRGQCSMTELLSSMPQTGLAKIMGTEAACIFQHMPHQTSYLGNPLGNSGAPPMITSDCMIGRGDGRTDESSSVRYDTVFRFQYNNGDYVN